MDNKINIQVEIAKNIDTNLPQVARFTSLTIHENGSIYMNYHVDVLSLDKSKVMLPDHEQGRIKFDSSPVSRGDETVVDELTPEMEALVTAVKPKITALLETLNTAE